MGFRGYGYGYRLLYPRKPVPVARVDGFDPVSNSARKRERMPAQQSKLFISGHHNRQLPQKHEQGGEMGGASTHFLKRYVIYCTLLVVFKTLQNPYCSPHPSTLENEHARSFSTVIGCSSPPPSNHSQKRARVCSFLMVVDCSSPPPSNHPRKRAHACSFSRVVACLSLVSSYLHHLSAPPPPKRAGMLIFVGGLLFYYFNYFILIF